MRVLQPGTSQTGAAMPTEGLPQQLAARLQARRAQVARALEAHLHAGGSADEAGLPRRSDDTDDDGAAETQRERDLTEFARLTAELTQLDAALARAASAEFGTCEDCGEAIDAARLTANPAALRCAECQQHAELRQTMARRRRA